MAASGGAAEQAPLEELDLLSIASGTKRSPRKLVVLNTAIGMFAERGYDDVTIRDIGGRLGVTSTSLYRHYSSKAALLADAFQLVVEALVAGLTDIVQRPGEPRGRLAEAVRFHVDFALRHRTYLRVYYLEVHHLAGADRVTHRRRAVDYRSLWVRLLTEADVVSGPTEAEHVYAMAMAMINVGGTSRIHDVAAELLVRRTLCMVHGGSPSAAHSPDSLTP